MIIGITGKAGSGKDATADILVKNYGFARVALADPLKRICKEVFDFSDDQLWGSSEKRNAPDSRYLRVPAKRVENSYLQRVTEQPAEYLTPRHALQQLGTQWGRSCYENVWIEHALRVAKTLLEITNYQIRYSQKEGLHLDELAPRSKGVVIPDVRFQNEVDAIKAAGGAIWKIIRPGAGLSGAAGQHASEKEQESIPEDVIDHVIVNDHSLDHLGFLVEGSTLQGLMKSRKVDVEKGKIRPYDKEQKGIPPWRRKG